MKKVLTLVFFICLSSPLYADILLEPGIGYIHSSTKGDNIYGSRNLGEIKYSYNAGTLGLKLAWASASYLVGLDVQLVGMGSLKAENQGNNSNVHSTATQMVPGFFLGMNWSQNLRLRASYFVAGTLDADSNRSSANQPNLESGKGFGLGFDFPELLPFGSFFINYRNMAYEREGPKNEIKGHEVGLGISFPMLF